MPKVTDLTAASTPLDGTEVVYVVKSGNSRKTTVADVSDVAVAATIAELPTELNASGAAPFFVPRAWVNFNGTGTVAIRASGNVSSVTDNGTGDYTINFTTAMPDANYAVIATGGRSSGGGAIRIADGVAPTAASVRIQTSNNTGAALVDFDYVCVAIIR